MKRVRFHIPVMWPRETKDLLTQAATVDGPFLRVVRDGQTFRIPLTNVIEIITSNETEAAPATKPAIKTRQSKKAPRGLGKAKNAIAQAREERAARR